MDSKLDLRWPWACRPASYHTSVLCFLTASPSSLRDTAEATTSVLVFFPLKNSGVALAYVAQWIECWPVNQMGTSSIPSQGTCLGCGPGPQ